MTNSKSTQDQEEGFTLIELSIVLVIIGLIVGGVLVGQDLIKAAELRATVSQVEKYNTAVNTFRLKYNGLPGDLSNAETFFSAVSNADDTNQADGDGLVEGISATTAACTASVCHSSESAAFWYMLSNAGLISETIAATDYEALTLALSGTAPEAKGGNGYVLTTAIGGRNYLAIVGAPSSGAVADGGDGSTFTAALTPTEAFQIDSKIDDGSPVAGTMLSLTVGTPLPGTASAASDCNSTSNYAIGSATADTLSCNLGMRAQF